MSYRPISDVPPIIPIPSATTPTIAQPSALTALLLRAKLTDDGHCYLYAVAGLVPATLWTRKVEPQNGHQWVMGRIWYAEYF